MITVNPRVSRRAARLTTNILAPANLVIAGLPLVGLAANPPLAGFLWGCLAALFAGVIPLTVILLGVRRGKLSDVHIVDREQRHLPLLVSIFSVALGLALLYVLHAAGEVRALTVAMLAGLISTAAVTRIWKVSIHTAVATGFAVVFGTTFGVVGWLAVLPAAAIGWSRVRLGDHTVSQVLGGALLGAIVTASVYTTLAGMSSMH